MPKGVYPRKKRHYRRGRVVTFKPSKEVAAAIAQPPPRTLWDVVSGWKLEKLKAVFERIPID